jgi:NADH-quinone oxidoreductase subunit L
LSIAGIFPFSGFWSKVEILAKAWFDGEYALWAIGGITALLTAFYMTRQVWLVFYGDERWRDPELIAATAAEPHTEEEAAASGAPIVVHAEGGHGADNAHDGHDDHGGEPHDVPWTMALPLAALAVLSAIGGLLNLPFTDPPLEFLSEWLHPVFEDVPEINAPSFSAGFVLSTVALIVAVFGIVVGRALYRHGLDADARDPMERRLGRFAGVLENAYYLDSGLARFVSGPVTAFADFVARGVDRGVIDGAVNGIASGARRLGLVLHRVQTGLVRNYALGIVLGTVLLMIYFATRVTM